jgi:hypothetical protein
MVAFAPTRGTPTIYNAIGDVFAWLCVGALVLLPFARRARI